ncbi:methylthioribulose 1-phosphate dehydratase [Cryptosporangium arvum]|uniref:Methylthioribulose-1-phosphate dehydratase n=1 Tax=Cryptosporangium arvum DSM 44712 TaxID=927661 RepID=A0A010ZMB1_9ACTN|nr:methylthioribulose 1-phosphate dehydratase [Cryptosporangium arvum]EXG79779.1 methylthioribulose-1-phosphate dehydratase [Cryptosporangium arvum DSM 44712]
MTGPDYRTDFRGVLEGAGTALAAESARFAGIGWMRGTSGNLSIVLNRDPLRLAVTVSGLDKGELTSADVVVVDELGRAVAEQPRPDLIPSAEAELHARVAQLSGAGAVVHVHALQAVLAGHWWPGGIELRDLEMLKGIGRLAHDETVTIPVVPNSQDMKVLGDDVAKVFDPAVPAVVVARHGMYAWGRDLLQARHHTEIVEFLLQFTVETRG